MRRSFCRLSILLAAAALATAGAGHAQIQVVDMTPQLLSGETTNDSEPNLAVDPANPLHLAASAFTPDPMGGPLAPIYVSTDGGGHWTLNSLLPGNDPVNGTHDVTLRFGGASGILYAGILRGDTTALNILRAADFAAGTPATLLVSHGGDQPWVQAATVMGGGAAGSDRVYVGYNGVTVPSGQTATIERSLDGATAPAPAGFAPFTIETRTTAGSDGAAIRTAIHPDGTVYGLFYRWTDETGGPSVITITADVVLVRSDYDWAAGAMPFTALTDPGDGHAGRLVATGRTIPYTSDATLFPTLGQNRLLGSNLSLAVDPRDSDRVWIAWADRVGTADYTLHVRRSETRGATWPGPESLTITGATNPALAVNARGRAGFLYQQLTGPAGSRRWQTHLRRSDDGAAWTDDVLADTSAEEPVVDDALFLGDYLHLLAAGKDFYGVFSASNAPVTANFPHGVTYLRNADWTAGTLLPASGPGTVPVSIDPFFFKVTDTPADQDFYVRDWTDGVTSADAGQEPSTHPVFFVTSDVWNQFADTAPAFNAADQPVASDVRNGAGALGDNFAFARVHRKAAGPAASVRLHFLYANFGAGLSYQDAGAAPDPMLAFPAGSSQQTMAAGYPWHLDPTASDHLCLGVEISGPGTSDPFIPPSLAGGSPGWPSTDLRVMADNNKAQRNILILPTGMAGAGTGGAGGAGTSGAVSGFAIVHNAATFPRTVEVRYEAAPEVVKKLGGARVEVVGQPARPFRSGDTLRLDNMQPGENRWLRVTFGAPSGREGEILPVYFREMAGEAAVNGFAIAARPSPLAEVLRHDLETHRSVFNRMAALTGSAAAAAESRAAALLLGRREIPEQEYAAFLREHGRALEDGLAEARRGTGWKAFGDAGDPGSPGHWARQLEELDALLTVRQLAAGDPADILQTVRWQRDLYRRAGAVPGAEVVLRESARFIDGYTRRELGNAAYPGLVKALLGSYREAARAFESPEMERTAAGLESGFSSLAALQKAHRSFLLALQGCLDRAAGRTPPR
jgi:hypothetical protein